MPYEMSCNGAGGCGVFDVYISKSVGQMTAP